MANTTANINVRVESEIKSQAQELLRDLGLDMTTAINVFLRQVIKKNGIPFEVVAEQPRQIKREFGCMKGKMWEADDHDWFEPLEDFKEYM